MDNLSVKLSNQKTISESKYSYDVMSDAIVWADEIVEYSVDEINIMRELWSFRAGLLLNQNREKHQSTWSKMRRLAPTWPGFREERCNPCGAVIDFLNFEKSKSDRYLDRVERAMKGLWRPLRGIGACGKQTE